MSLHQLRCGGVLETMRIAAAGFPTRWPFAKFCERYRVLAPNLFDQFKDKWSECAGAIIKKIGLEAHQYQLGTTKVCLFFFFQFMLCFTNLQKVFLRAGLVALFEELLKRKMEQAAILVQKHVRGFVKRRQFLRMKRDAADIQSLIRRLLARHLLATLRVKMCAVLVQAKVRACALRRRFLRLKAAVARVQRRVRARIMRKMLRKLVAESRLAARDEQHRVRLVTRCQAVIRMKLQRRKFLVIRAEARDVKGKFQKVMDEKSQLEKKNEELTWRLTADSRAKAKLQEEKAELEERLKKESEESEALRKEVRAQKKLLEETTKKLAEASGKLAETSTRRDELSVQVEEARKVAEEKDAEIAKLKIEAEQSRTNKADEEKMAAQAARIAELESEVKRVGLQLEEEKQRAREITESVMSLRTQEVDLLQSKIQGAYGFVPNETYLGLPDQTNSPPVLAARQQMETLARMTAKKTKDEGVFALLDFLLLHVNEGFTSGDNPVLGLSLVHVLNHWDCFRKDRADLLDHVVQGLDVEIATMASSNLRLSYVLNSILFLLHATDQQLLVAGVEDPWYTDSIVMDADVELPELNAVKQKMPNTIVFLNKVRHLAARMYMELVFNVEESLEPLLRPCIAALVSGNSKGSRNSFQAVIKELQAMIHVTSACFWPPSVVTALLKQILFYVDAFLVNSVLAQKVLCSREAATGMSEWVADLLDWISSLRFAASEECLAELARLRQVLELLMFDKAVLAKQSEAAARKLFPDLLAPQVKQLLNNYVTSKGEEAVPVRVIRALTAGREEGDLLIDKTMLFPLSVKQLHDISFGEMVSLPFPQSVGKLLAEEMASRDVIDDEYVLVRFNLESFEIGDQMDEIELEEDSFNEESLQDLDEETRQRLMLAFDDNVLGKSVSGNSTLRLKSERRDSVADVTAAAAADDNRLGASDLIREKLQARLEAKKREKEEEERKKKEQVVENLDSFAWQVGDSCEALFIDDGEWYAAEVMDGPNDEGQFHVLFTEYGNMQWTEPEFMRLSEEMLQLLAPGESNDEGLPMEESTIFGDDVSLVQESEDPFQDI